MNATADSFVVPSEPRGRWCPVCGNSSRRFRRHGQVKVRLDAKCAYCGAVERHRLIWLFFHRRTDLFDGRSKKFLDVGPERCLMTRFAAAFGDGYVSAAPRDPRALVQTDLAEIPCPENAFDAIYCSDVLEHVPDDRRAMKELHRVLKPAGWLVLTTTFIPGPTREDPSVTDPYERLMMFGQKERVRRYGADVADRLREAGFAAELCTVHDLCTPEEARLLGLRLSGRAIFYCKKAAPAG